jgi:hypothetical protein
MDEKTTRAVVRAARVPRPGRPAADRVADAMAHGVAVLGASARSAGAGVDRSASRGMDSPVVLSETSLSAVKPQIELMAREEFAAMLWRVCEETGIWPQRP